MSDFKILTKEEKEKLTKQELVAYIMQLATQYKRAKGRLSHEKATIKSLYGKRQKIDELKMQNIRKKLQS